MTDDLTFSVSTTPFSEDYQPSASSRSTTNFANLARGEHRQVNLRNALTMINRRFNDLARWDNPRGDRYVVELEIVSVDLHLGVDGAQFPLIEMLDTTIVDSLTGERIDGIAGNNFSSYVRDYDFSVLLPELKAAGSGIPAEFGALHGKLFSAFVESEAYRERSSLPPVICISVSSNRTYTRLENRHPILGVEYAPDASSPTDDYFGKMGLRVRYFLPRGASAPLAFYHRGDLPNAYSNLALIGLISTMETFQKIYRPEIYNANSAAAEVFRPSLENADFSVTQISYDREERSRLGVTQGRFTHEHLIAPYGDVLERWAAGREPVLVDADGARS